MSDHYCITTRPTWVFKNEWVEGGVSYNYTAHWLYQDAEGFVFGAVVRFDNAEHGKLTIPYFVPTESGDFKPGYGGLKNNRPLYGIGSLTADGAIHIGEGEKVSTALHMLGLAAVSWAGGPDAVSKADWAALAKAVGDRRIVLLPDNDAQGRKAMASVQTALINAGVAADKIDVVDGLITGQPDAAGSDIADWLTTAAGWNGYGELGCDATGFRKTLLENLSVLADKLPEDWAPVKAATPTLTADQGYAPLGTDGEDFLIYSVPQKHVVRFTPSSFSIDKLDGALGSGWINARYSSDEGRLNLRALKNDIREACRAAGFYRDDKVRGAGIYSDGSDALIINDGDQLYRTDGAKISRLSSRVVYKPGCDLDVGREEMATEKDMERLLEAFQTSNYKEKGMAGLVFAWGITAPLCGALDHRPMLALTGKTHSGKSTVYGLLKAVIGPGVVAADARKSTPIGVMQDLKLNSIPVLLDQCESEGPRARGFVEDFRSGYNDEDGGVKGTKDGNARRSTARFSGALFAVRLPEMAPEDLNRFVVAEIDRPKKAFKSADTHDLIKHDFTGAKCMSFAIKKRMTALWKPFVDSLEVIKDVLIDGGFNNRQATTYGPLLAGYHIALNAKAITPEQAKALAMELGVVTVFVEEGEVVEEEDRCLERLLNSTLNTANGPRSIASLITRSMLKLPQTADKLDVVHTEHAASEAARILGTAGIAAVKNNEGKRIIAVSADREHPGLGQLYRGSRWENGGWVSILARTEGAKKGTCRIDARCVYAVQVPMPTDLLANAGRHIEIVPDQTEQTELPIEAA